MSMTYIEQAMNMEGEYLAEVQYDMPASMTPILWYCRGPVQHAGINNSRYCDIAEVQYNLPALTTLDIVILQRSSTICWPQRLWILWYCRGPVWHVGINNSRYCDIGLGIINPFTETVLLAATSKFGMVWSLSNALRCDVEQELDRLRVSSGKDRSQRLFCSSHCGSLKVWENTNLGRLQSHRKSIICGSPKSILIAGRPILHSCRSVAVHYILDLSHAFKQHQLDWEQQNFVTIDTHHGSTFINDSI